MLLHIPVIRLDGDRDRATIWHSLTPPVRVLCVFLMLLAIALTPNGHWGTWAVYGIGIVWVLWLSRISVAVLLKRLVVESAFVGVILLGTVFRPEGEVLWQWGPLQVTTVGVLILGSVTTKALLSLLLLNLLTLTTSVPGLLQALLVLKVPPLLVAILASMYRYLEVLIAEFTTMKRAALSRNLMGQRRWQRLVLGNMIGSLFIRTVDRGDRIHRAMIARGYQGLRPVVTQPLMRGHRDILALTFTLCLALLGQAIYLDV